MSKVFVFLLSTFCALTVMVIVTGLLIIFERFYEIDVSPPIISITVIGISALFLLAGGNDCICLNDPIEDKES